MKSLQSDMSNFDHQKGVKAFTFQILYTRSANLHSKMYPCANFHNIRIKRFKGSHGLKYARRTQSMPLRQLLIAAALNM